MSGFVWSISVRGMSGGLVGGICFIIPAVPRPPGTDTCTQRGRWSVCSSQNGPSDVVVVSTAGAAYAGEMSMWSI